MRKHKREDPPKVKGASKSLKHYTEPMLVERLESVENSICDVLKLFEDLQKILNKDKGK